MDENDSGPRPTSHELIDVLEGLGEGSVVVEVVAQGGAALYILADSENKIVHGSTRF
jgi:hypothetical protein